VTTEAAPVIAAQLIVGAALWRAGELMKHPYISVTRPTRRVDFAFPRSTPW
jgi:hypothetical protein